MTSQVYIQQATEGLLSLPGYTVICHLDASWTCQWARQNEILVLPYMKNGSTKHRTFLGNDQLTLGELDICVSTARTHMHGQLLKQVIRNACCIEHMPQFTYLTYRILFHHESLWPIQSSCNVGFKVMILAMSFQLRLISQKLWGLSRMIKDKKQPEFDHVPANKLNLWKVSIPLHDSLNENLSWLEEGCCWDIRNCLRPRTGQLSYNCCEVSYWWVCSYPSVSSNPH